MPGAIVKSFFASNSPSECIIFVIRAFPVFYSSYMRLQNQFSFTFFLRPSPSCREHFSPPPLPRFADTGRRENKRANNVTNMFKQPNPFGFDGVFEIDGYTASLRFEIRVSTVFMGRPLGDITRGEVLDARPEEADVNGISNGRTCVWYNCIASVCRRTCTLRTRNREE